MRSQQTVRQPGLTQGRGRDLILLLTLATLWGSSYLFIKVAVAEVPALVLVTGRLFLSTVILWILLRVSGEKVPRARAQWGAYAVMGFLSGALPWSLITWGEQYISSGLAALLQATMPIFTVILAHFLTGDERISTLAVVGVVVGFGGVAILMLPDLREVVLHRSSQAHFLGQLAIVVSSISYAGGAIFARSHLRREPPLVSSTGQLTMGLAFMLPLSLFLGQYTGMSLPSLPTLASWLGLTILGTVAAYLIYYSLIARTSATFVSTVTYVIPVNGLILGALVLSEPLTGGLLLSLALILLGVMLVRA